MKRNLFFTAACLSLLMLAGCSDSKDDSASNAPAMQCGAGKCGASMISGDSALAKKQRNILSQMRADDPRMGCVMGAKTTEALYDCVRDPETGELTLDYNASK